MVDLVEKNVLNFLLFAQCCPSLNLPITPPNVKSSGKTSIGRCPLDSQMYLFKSFFHFYKRNILALTPIYVTQLIIYITRDLTHFKNNCPRYPPYRVILIADKEDNTEGKNRGTLIEIRTICSAWKKFQEKVFNFSTVFHNVGYNVFERTGPYG